MFMILIVLLTAIAISAVAAYFSIVGLAALFAATATGVIVMAATLEVGKIVTTKLIHTLWRSKRATWMLKGPLMVMVASLMAVTSLGIYGYLSKGHLEQNAPMAGITIQSAGLERQVAQREAENKRLESRLAQIDQNINSFLTQDQASKGLKASEQMKAERAKIQTQIDANYAEINKLSEQLVPLKIKGSEVEAKLGPVKYVAALFGMEDTEGAVRIVILLIMIAFDPLAICLIIAASVAYDDYKERKLGKTEDAVVEEITEPEAEPEDDGALELAETERLAALNTALQSEIEAFKAELDEARTELVTQQAALNAAKTAHLLDVQELESDRSAAQSNAERLETTSNELLILDADLKDRAAALALREAELADRVTLLERFFPAGSTDDQAIIALLEKNPKILEEIVDIIETSKKKDEGSGPVMIVRS